MKRRERRLKTLLIVATKFCLKHLWAAHTLRSYQKRQTVEDSILDNKTWIVEVALNTNFKDKQVGGPKRKHDPDGGKTIPEGRRANWEKLVTWAEAVDEEIRYIR